VSADSLADRALGILRCGRPEADHVAAGLQPHAPAHST
jgi:hypothetical protein